MATTRQRHERLLRRFERATVRGTREGILRLRAEAVDGPTVTVDGHTYRNFGLAAYLGLNRDPRIVEAAVAAVRRFGATYSSSVAFSALDLYEELETRLSAMTGGHVVIAATTTLAHFAALPILVAPGSLVLVDSQAHASLHLAAQNLAGAGSTVALTPHNDVAALESAVADAEGEEIWFLTDGIFSMFGETSPVEAIVELLDRHPRLRVYFDDAHGFGWTGVHGRGFVLNRVPLHERMVVAASLSKSFASGGGVLIFPDEEQARHVRMLGGTVTFSGPLHPAELGAAVASADIHLSAEHEELRERIADRIDLTARLLAERELPVVSYDRTPIWFIKMGSTSRTIALAQALMAEGFYANPTDYAAVPLGSAGLRFANSLFHPDETVVELADCLARHVPAILDEAEVVVDLTDTSPDR